MPMRQRAELIVFLDTEDEIRRRELAAVITAASIPPIP
jgi:hypothetical protein